MNGEPVLACVLPSLRLSRLANEVLDLLGDAEQTRKVMQAVDRHIEQNAQRWGNACPVTGCDLRLEWVPDRGHRCPAHGLLGHMAATKLLIAFDPITSPADSDA